MIVLEDLMRIHSYSNIPDNTTDSALTNAEVSKYNSVKLGRSTINHSFNKITRDNHTLRIIKSRIHIVISLLYVNTYQFRII